MKVEDQQRPVVECREGLHNERHTLRSILFTHLLSQSVRFSGTTNVKGAAHILFTWGEKNKTLWLRNAKHERLHFELGATADDRVEINTEYAGELPVWQCQVWGVIMISHHSRVLRCCLCYLEDVQSHNGAVAIVS